MTLPLIACRHPLFDRESPLVIGGDYITTETGTGLVHTAPGHGQEDYLVGQRYGLDLLSPVDDAGNFTEEAGEKFKGLNVQVRAEKLEQTSRSCLDRNGNNVTYPWTGGGK